MKIFDVESFISQLLANVNDRGELTGNIHGGQPLYWDMDDWVPFLLYYGYKDYVRSQIARSEKYIRYGFLPSNGYLLSWRMDEYLGGLWTFVEMTEESWFKDIQRTQLRFLSKALSVQPWFGYFSLNKEVFSSTAYPRGANLLEAILEHNTMPQVLHGMVLKNLKNMMKRNRFFY